MSRQDRIFLNTPRCAAGPPSGDEIACTTAVSLSNQTPDINKLPDACLKCAVRDTGAGADYVAESRPHGVLPYRVLNRSEFGWRGLSRHSWVSFADIYAQEKHYMRH